MQIKAETPEEYIDKVPEDRKEAFVKLRTVILENLPDGFEEVMNYGMIGYVIPHSLYPDGYHCNPDSPLPFMSIASQKNFIGLYHMGIYANEEILNWFTEKYAKQVPAKLDMGKSCIRFKKMEHIPYELVGELTSKISAGDWINTYENAIKR